MSEYSCIFFDITIVFYITLFLISYKLSVTFTYHNTRVIYVSSIKFVTWAHIYFKKNYELLSTDMLFWILLNTLFKHFYMDR